MKTPPQVDRHAAALATIESRMASQARRLDERSERDRRFLVFVAVVVAALAVGLKSELIAPGSAWWFAAGLCATGALLVLAYLSAVTDSVRPGVEHYVPAVLGSLAVAGFSLIVSDYRLYTLTAVAFAVGLASAARLDYDRITGRAKRGHAFLQEAVLAAALLGAFIAVITSPFSLSVRLAWIFAAGALAAFRSFRLGGDSALPPRRAILFSLIVAQVLVFFAWAIWYYVAGITEGVFAAMLLLAWYINRGVIRHTAEETLTRHVVMEYGLVGGVLALLFLVSYRPS